MAGPQGRSSRISACLRNGWGRPRTIGNYGEDYLSRTAINLIGIWANNTSEVVYFKTDSDGTGTKLDGGKTYAITFPADASADQQGPLLLVGDRRRLGQVPGDPERTRPVSC